MKQYGSDNNYWLEDGNKIDISRHASHKLKCQTTTVDLIFSPLRSSLIIIDMQNFFLSEKLGRKKNKSLIYSIKAAINFARKNDMQIIWLNWGVEKHLMNIPPSVLRTFNRSEIYPGFGNSLPHHMGPMLLKNSWSAQLIPELDQVRGQRDLWIDKNRISGFYGTDLDEVLRNAGMQSLFFAGVNTDQCVLATIYDAVNIGYDCILLSDCTATTSPKGAYESVIYNIEKSGFVMSSRQLIEATL